MIKQKEIEFKENPLHGRNELLVKSQVVLMNKYADEGNYTLAIMYRNMIWNCETFFGKFPHHANVSKDFPRPEPSQIYS